MSVLRLLCTQGAVKVVNKVSPPLSLYSFKALTLSLLIRFPYRSLAPFLFPHFSFGGLRVFLLPCLYSGALGVLLSNCFSFRAFVVFFPNRLSFRGLIVFPITNLAPRLFFMKLYQRFCNTTLATFFHDQDRC